MPTKLVGQNYTTPDLVAKVTGRARFSDDYRVDGMLFAKLLISPMPHARVRSIDASAALERPGVICVVTGDDLSSLHTMMSGAAPLDDELGQAVAKAIANQLIDLE